MSRTTWNVVAHWLADRGSEFVETRSFTSLAEAGRELSRLAPLLGVLADARVLKDVRLVECPAEDVPAPALTEVAR